MSLYTLARCLLGAARLLSWVQPDMVCPPMLTIFLGASASVYDSNGLCPSVHIHRMAVSLNPPLRTWSPCPSIDLPWKTGVVPPAESVTLGTPPLLITGLLENGGRESEGLLAPQLSVFSALSIDPMMAIQVFIRSSSRPFLCLFVSLIKKTPSLGIRRDSASVDSLCTGPYLP